MTKFIEIKNCGLIAKDSIYWIYKTPDNFLQINFSLVNCQQEPYEKFETEQQRDARFEELKRILCGEDNK